jgi:metallo-beta-lactamase family protein
MGLSLSFLGAAGTVTGSRFLLESGGSRLLVDCGLFQGLKDLRNRNWEPFPVPPESIDAVLLTHAHIDHSGYLPALVRDGFRGRIFCSHATMELCQILWRDSGYLQEKEAQYASRQGFSKHKPALPLYTVKDAEAALPRLSPIAFDKVHRLPNGPAIRLRHAGHILGAATIECVWDDTRLVFSGDLGRFGDAMMLDPEPVPAADYLVVESTYGNRHHDARDPQEALGEVIARTIALGGTVIIPAFAVGRAQSLLYHLERLKSAGQLKNVPIFLDSPMAINASEMLCSHLGDHRLPADACVRACDVAHYVRDVEESKALMNSPVPKVIISASGMATGGRVLHHLKRYAPDRRNTILFAGFQAVGTRGAAMLAGAESVKIHGALVPVRAQVENLSILSAHADADEILHWLRNFRTPPRMTFIVHGEPDASAALRQRIEGELGWACRAPQLLEQAVISRGASEPIRAGELR